MLIDITLSITPEMTEYSPTDRSNPLAGHLGTHFDVMNKEFPLEYTCRKGVVFDVSGVTERDISTADVDTELIGRDMFVGFFSGYIEAVPYGSKGYFSNHPQLSDELIELLLDRGVSIIGLDFAGIRRGKEHTSKDAYCADRGTFVVENLCNLKEVVVRGGRFTAHTYPMSYTDVTGLPCRVIAEI